jgi:hypothetical protein
LICEDVAKWNRDMESLLKTKFDLINSTTQQEQAYWNSYVNSLRSLEASLETEEANLQITILRNRNKFHYTASYETIYASVKKTSKKAVDINNTFKEMKFQELMTSQTIEELGNVLGPILITMRRLTNKDYETKRLYQLVEVLSKDIASQLHKILGNENLMFCSWADFKSWYEKAEDIFKKFEENIGTFLTGQATSSSVGSSYNRVISSSSHQSKVVYHYLPLKSRFEQLYKIRELYQTLKSVIEDIINKSNNKDFLTTAGIEEGYNHFKGVNVLDHSKEGDKELSSAEKEFYTQIDLAENYITKKLK